LSEAKPNPSIAVLKDFDFKNLLDVESLDSFDCSEADLNEFFKKDAGNYNAELLGKTYCFTSKDNPPKVVCAFTVSNDSLNLEPISRSAKKRVDKAIPYPKRMKTYPAVKIGRLGVNKDFQRQGVGSGLMNFIKAWFSAPENKTGCRFIIVDAYNNPDSLNYYQKNEFKFLHVTEETEKEQYDKSKLNTRLMYFDLFKLIDNTPPKQIVV